MSDARIEEIRSYLPATNNQIYLNTGTFGPLSRVVRETMEEHIREEYERGRIRGEAFANMATVYQNAREEVAQLLHAEAEEITLTQSTGEGLNHVCYGFPWQAGDEIITTNHEHISVLAPLYQIRDRFGVQLRFADLGPSAENSLRDSILPLISQRTRLIVISHVTWSTGTVIDIASAVQLAQEHGIFIVIDGAQSAGSIALDMRALEADAYSIPMQKWLCGPEGTGALYIRKESLSKISPTYVGFWSESHPKTKDWELQHDSRRFELGTRSTACVAGQAAALRWLREEVGHTWLFEHISALHTYAYRRLQNIPGINIFTPRAGASGLIAFTAGNLPLNDVVKQLNEGYGIVIRSLPEPFSALRVSTGFYNTTDEIDTLIQALETIMAR